MKPHPALSLAVLLLACSGKELQPPPSTPVQEEAVSTTSPAPGPTLHEVVAVEVELDATNRRYTRDPATVEAVLEALGPTNEWTPSGMPRCKPRLWARLVPPSGEGGATYQFCSQDSPGYAFLPEQGSWMLPDDRSAALYALTAGLELPDQGTIPPVVVTDHLSSLVLTVAIAPPAKAPQGLRRLTLAVSSRLEPDPIWEDGSPMGRSLMISEDQARALVDALALSGFFHRGTKYHSPLVDDPGTPPAGSTEGPPPVLEQGGAVGITVTGEPWHHTWHEASAAPIFEHSVDSLRRCELGEEASAALEQLVEQLADG